MRDAGMNEERTRVETEGEIEANNGSRDSRDTKEINSTIDKRPVGRQSAAVWADTAAPRISAKKKGVDR